MESFKQFLERLTEPPAVRDYSRRPDLIKGGETDCQNQPLGVRSMCTGYTSAFPTYKKNRVKK